MAVLFSIFLLQLLSFGFSQMQTGSVMTGSTTTVCQDYRTDCFRYGDNQCVGDFAPWAKMNCAYRCGYCEKKLPCVDEIKYCDDYPDSQCTNKLYGEYMRKNCRKTCNLCVIPAVDLTTPEPSTTPMTTPAPTTPTTPNPVSAWCHDDADKNCWQYPDEKCHGIYEDFARLHCPYRCGYCPGYHPPCEDQITYCDGFHNGTCNNDTYKAFMRENCRKYCGECSYPGLNLPPNVRPSTIPHSTITVEPSVGTNGEIPTTAAPNVSPGKIPTRVTSAVPVASSGGVPQTVTPSAATDNTAVTFSTMFPTLPTGADCKDTQNCSSYNSESCVGIFKSWAMKNCPRHCGYCEGQNARCEDYEICEHLPVDICTNKQYGRIARTSCRKFCGFCTDTSVTKPMMPSSTQQPSTDTPATDSGLTTAAPPSRPAGSVPTIFPVIPTGDACRDSDTLNCSATYLTPESCTGAYKATAIKLCPQHCGYCDNGVNTSKVTDMTTEMPSNACSKMFSLNVPACCSDLCACNDTIHGQVLDASQNGSPLFNVTVFFNLCPCQSFAMTDSDGRYSISGICIKGSVMRFELGGYRSYLADPTKTEGQNQYIANANLSLDLLNVNTTASVAS